MSDLSPVPKDSGFQLAVPAPAEFNTAPAAPKFRVKKFVVYLRKFWWIPVITLVLALGISYYNYRALPLEYTAYASMWETEKLQLPDGANFSENHDTYFGTLTAVLQSPTLRQLALARLSMAGTNNIALDKDGNPISVQVNVFQAPRSLVYNLQAVSSSASFTPLYLDALMASFLDYKKNVRSEVSGGTLASISAKITEIAQEMKSDQAVLGQFQQSNNIAVLQQESQVMGAYLARLRTDMAGYQLQNRLLDAVVVEKTLLMTNSVINSLLGTEAGSTPAAIQSADQQVATLSFQRDKLAKYLRPEHPKMVKLNEEIALATNQISVYRTQNQQQIDIARQSLNIRIESVQQAIADWEVKVLHNNSLLAQADELKANIQRNQSLYERLLALLQNVDITRNIDQESLAILQPASVASRTYGKLQSSLSTGAVGGIALGLAIILLLAFRDDRFSSIVEVNEFIGGGLLGQVPEMPEMRDSKQLALLESNDERHMYVESFRNLRSALLYLAVEGNRPRLIMITSAVPNEGKSTISANLSCAMALGGSRVLLIDGDLRKGRLHDLLGLQSKPGLAELLREPENMDQFIQPSQVENLSFIARGSLLRNPGDLFLSSTLDAVLARLRERFDYIIIDSSPVFAADDATTLAPRMDGTLFVVRSHFSHANMVKQALELLAQRQAVVLGLILNRTDATDRSYHYYKYSEYYASAEAT